MAKIDWMFLPSDIEEDAGDGGMPQRFSRKARRVGPYFDIAVRRSIVSIRLEPRPGSTRSKIDSWLVKRR